MVRHAPSIGIGIGLSLRSQGFGVSYVKAGRVLDYSTQVGPFTIVDKSGEGNTATLYSGRGLTMDAVNDTVTYATGYSSVSRTATLWGKFNTTSPVVLIGSVSGFFVFYPTATGVWEELTSTATVEGDLAWDLGLDFDIGDLTCATEHWTHNDWSDPTGDTSNGKTIVDSGPNDYHGTCTGCSGFTGEATIPQTADKNWNNLAGQMVTASDANDQIDALGTAILEPRLNTQQLNLFGDGEHSSTPDSASLDVTTAATWELWGNFYESFSGSGDIYLSKFNIPNRSFLIQGNNGAEVNRVRILLSSGGTTLAWIGYIEVPDSVEQMSFTYDGSTNSVVGYVNGVATTVTTTLGSVPSSLFVGTADLLIGKSGEGTATADRKIGSAKIYNVALTADEVLTNYNTQKSKYGL